VELLIATGQRRIGLEALRAATRSPTASQMRGNNLAGREEISAPVVLEEDSAIAAELVPTTGLVAAASATGPVVAEDRTTSGAAIFHAPAAGTAMRLAEAPKDTTDLELAAAAIVALRALVPEEAAGSVAVAAPAAVAEHDAGSLEGFLERENRSAG
jgi:hypothetical protein